MKKIFTYGSLKRGFFNNGWLGKDSVFHREFMITGYDMYNMCVYPAIKEGTGTIKGEIFIITDENFENIKRMEEQANYKTVEQEIGEELCYLWVYKGDLSNNQKIEDGEWLLSHQN